MKKQTVYIPISVHYALLPQDGELYSISFNGGKTFGYETMGKGWNLKELNYTHWLKPIDNVYVFTEDELLNIIAMTAAEVKTNGYGGCSVTMHFARVFIKEVLRKLKMK